MPVLLFFIIFVPELLTTIFLNCKIMYKTILKDVKKGDFFHLNDNENSPLWIRGNFERSLKKYSIISYNDSCKELFRKGSTLVYVECLH